MRTYSSLLGFQILLLLSGCSGAYSLTNMDGSDDLIVVGKNHVGDPVVNNPIVNNDDGQAPSNNVSAPIDVVAPVAPVEDVIHDVAPGPVVESSPVVVSSPPVVENNDDDYAMDPIVSAPVPVVSNDSQVQPPVVEVVASTDDDETGEEYCKNNNVQSHDSSNDKVLVCHRAGKKDNGVDILISRAGWENGHSKHFNDHLGSCSDVEVQQPQVDANLYSKCK